MANQSGFESPSEFSKKPPPLSHLRRLTTDRGIIQHARGEKPDLRFGYSIDDSARALVVCLWYADLYGVGKVRKLAQIYLEQIAKAQLPNGSFHNFQDRGGRFLDQEGSQDSFGRTIWALGVAVHHPLVGKGTAQRLLMKALPNVHRLQYIRSIAFALLGLAAAGYDPEARELGRKLVVRLHKRATSDWQWYEDCLRYSNGILPYALLKTGDQALIALALKTLDFLNDVSRVDGVPAPIGNKGWYCKGGERAIFDQQCIDAADMVLANVAAYQRTDQQTYFREAHDWMRWFYGFNVKGVVMVTKDGGCYDGLNERRVNRNQGAESVLAFLLAYLTLAGCARLSKISSL